MKGKHIDCVSGKHFCEFKKSREKMLPKLPLWAHYLIIAVGLIFNKQVGLQKQRLYS